MNVEELIKTLEQYPKDAKVVVPDDLGYFCNPLVDYYFKKVIISADSDED
jgi:hypothetical protein